MSRIKYAVPGIPEFLSILLPLPDIPVLGKEDPFAKKEPKLYLWDWEIPCRAYIDTDPIQTIRPQSS